LFENKERFEPPHCEKSCFHERVTDTWTAFTVVVILINDKLLIRLKNGVCLCA